MSIKMFCKLQCFLSFFGNLYLVIATNSLDERLVLKPQSETIVKPTYRLYTLKNLDSPEVLDYKTSNTLYGSNFESGLPTKFIIHGYTEEPLSPKHWTAKMKDELLKKEAMNVIVVRWTDGANCIDYFQSAANTRTVASATIKLILRLVELKNGSISKMHVIGHSLGAQISGFIGSQLAGILPRITGLDPAGPSFENVPIEDRLDPSDAKFVDVIHSNGKPLLEAGFGFMYPCGHVDFFPDGGKYMPGCKPHLKDVITALLDRKFRDIFHLVACSHMRAIYLFTESINSSCKFCSYACKDYSTYEKGLCSTCTGNGCSRLGYYADQFTKTGIFYLKTNPQPPYCATNAC